MRKIINLIAFIFATTLVCFAQNLPTKMYFGKYEFYNYCYDGKGTMRNYVRESDVQDCLNSIEEHKEEKEKKWDIEITNVTNEYGHIKIEYKDNSYYRKPIVGVSVCGINSKLICYKSQNPYISIQILPIDFGYGKSNIKPLIPLDSWYNGERTIIDDLSSTAEINICGVRFSGESFYRITDVNVLNNWSLQQYAYYSKFGFDLIKIGWCNDSWLFNQSFSIYPFVETIDCTTYDGSNNTIGWGEYHRQIARDFSYHAKYWGVGLCYRIGFIELNAMFSDFQKTFYVSGVLPLSSLLPAIALKNH